MKTGTKIAVISDIHGNVDALRAVMFREIDYDTSKMSALAKVKGFDDWVEALQSGSISRL